MRKALLILALCLTSGLAGYFAYPALSPRPPEAGLTAQPGGADSPVGQNAPELRLPDLDGTTRALSDWRGKLVLVNFWATWCTPCLHEIPLLVDAQKRHGARGLQVVGPAMDNADAVRSYMGRLGINYPVLVGEGAVGDAMTALGDDLGALPYSVLIDPQGLILASQHGEFSQASLDALIQQHLP